MVSFVDSFDAGAKFPREWPIHAAALAELVKVIRFKPFFDPIPGGKNPLISNICLPLRPHVVLDCQKLMGTQLWR